MNNKDNEKKVQINVSLSKRQRDSLRRIAAERMIEKPEKKESAASVGAEIITDFLDVMEEVQKKKRKEE